MNKKKFFAQKEWLLLGSIILFALILAFIFSFFRTSADTVIVCINGEVYGSYPLSVDQNITIPSSIGQNILVIQNRQVSMEQADCPDQICVKHKKISRLHETIVCLPAKIVVTITNESNSATSSQDLSIDAVSE